MNNLEGFRKKVFAAVIAFCVVTVSGALIVSCPGDPPPPPTDHGRALVWDFEIRDDRNPNQWAPGISILRGGPDEGSARGTFGTNWRYHPTRYSQTFTLNAPFVFGQPETGWFTFETITAGGMDFTVPVMEDARGFCTDSLWPYSMGQGDLMPKMVPVETQTMGPHGVMVDAIRLHGLLQQTGSESENPDDWVSRTGVWQPRLNPLTDASPATDFRRSAGWPSIALYATPPGLDIDPDQETRLAFMDGSGFTFWVRPMREFVAYRVSVENWEYRPDEGHEPGHWFGARPGRDGTMGLNFTPAPVGVWTQVTVVYDPHHPRFNMAVNNWIMMYSIQGTHPDDVEPYVIAGNHNKDNSIRIVFQLHLQHNGGDEGNDWIEFSVGSGRHEFDVYFYGIRVLEWDDL